MAAIFRRGSSPWLSLILVSLSLVACTPPGAEQGQVVPGGGGRIPRREKMYWVDNSCLAKDPQFLQYTEEALKMAQRAAERIQSGSDTDFARAYETVMKVSKDHPITYPRTQAYTRLWSEGRPETVVQQVVDTLQSIGNDWVAVGERMNAELRIYCNNGADFEQVDFGTNSKWMDVANLVMSNNQCPPPGTSGEGQGGYTKAYVARERVTPGDEDARDPKYLRSVMVLCDILWEHMQEPMQHTLGRLKNGTESIDFQTSSVEFVDFLTSKLILHEWTHTTFYLLDDHFGPSETTYGWHHALQLPAEDAVHDSESYAWLGAWAALADFSPEGSGAGGYAISRDISLWSDYDKTDPNGKLHQGKVMQAYRDITQ